MKERMKFEKKDGEKTFNELALTSLAVSRNHCLAVVALVMVSWVVKVFEATMNNEVSGFNFFKVSAM